MNIAEQRFERVIAALGNLARPSVLYCAGWSAGILTVRLAWMHPSYEAAAVIGAAWAGVAGLYWGKAVEERSKAKADAQVEIARAENHGRREGDGPRRPFPDPQITGRVDANRRRG